MADRADRADRAGPARAADPGEPVVACVDFGSTFTKAALVELGTGRLVATAEHPTTTGTDVLDGWRACLDALAETAPAAREAEVLACSSAGGGLRIAVVGNEELVTAEAGRRVALSSGGRVVHVAGGGLAHEDLPRLRAARADVLLLVGGTDGGNAETLLGAAAALAEARWPSPVVVAGNLDARAQAADLLAGAGTPHAVADNVVPRIGMLAPGSARGAIREVFLDHVIGGKHLSGSSEFAAMVRGATPDVVLTAVELLARVAGAGDVAVVDVGGATTDVHSVVEVDPDSCGSGSGSAGLSREVVAPLPLARTVEGDLGMRWSAEPTVEAAILAGLVEPAEEAGLRRAAARRQADPAYLPDNDGERGLEHRIAALAVTLALRRHAGRSQVVYADGQRMVERTGRDLRSVGLLVGSGGVLRHGSDGSAGPGTGPGHGPAVAETLRGLLRAGRDAAWQLPEAARVVVDRDYLLAPVGLLAGPHPDTARALVASLAHES